MTVTYTSKVATTTWFDCFIKLLLRWKGSIYKLIWLDVLCFLVLYYVLNFVYRFALNREQKRIFEELAAYCNNFGNLIPVSFVLGFYVTLVANRWWSQFQAIPFPDNLALLVSASIKRQDGKSKLIMRTIVRHVCFCFAYTLTLISPRVKRHYSSLDDFVDTGLLLKEEKEILDDLSQNYPEHMQYWLSLSWAANLVTRARHEGFIQSDPVVVAILTEINNFRTKCSTLLDYDWISVPLVYTQVVTLAVYSYFLIALFGRQWTEKTAAEYTDLYFPLLTLFEFIFYMGWLKVAEVLINPFGEDDEDFDVLWMIQRHMKVCYLIVDKMHHEHPKLVETHSWDGILQYLADGNIAPVPSTAKIKSTKSFGAGDRKRSSTDGTSKVEKRDSWYKKAHGVTIDDSELNSVETDKDESLSLKIDDVAKSSTSGIHDFEKLKEKRKNLIMQKTKVLSEEINNADKINGLYQPLIGRNKTIQKVAAI
ncbi:bestrophin-3-like isoform X2 [Agrilus planipennis]|uniref:Bestrophin homolog n=1 Tax=Agrilus planipennis TaxID=224129 RepID=A0A1W4XV00_AGRPL|nr:bestrophin-3-like isoform X2 [Agrilus planipennis]